MVIGCDKMRLNFQHSLACGLLFFSISVAELGSKMSSKVDRTPSYELFGQPTYVSDSNSYPRSR